MPVQMHPETAVGQLKTGDYDFPLQSVDVRGAIRGLLYSATIKQTFKNERDTRMEAVYVFPLPPKAAVHGFTLTIGDRVITGEIKERGQARRDYQQAVQSGHRAALMEEERSDIFTTTVGNIGPGEEVQIQFELSGPLSCFRNTARLRLPLVVGEVYIPGSELAGGSVGDGTTADTDQVPDASRITPPRLADGAPNPVSLSVSFIVEPSGLTVQDVVSTCHFARSKKFEDGRYRVSLLPGVERMDKAFILEVSYPEQTLQTSLLVDPKNKAFALTVVPPVAKERKTHPRDVVILLDRSGSMGGWPMIAARRAAARIIESLTQDDRFGIVAFDDNNEHFDFKTGLCHANNFYKMRAAEFLAKIDARGGTEALPALKAGLQYFGNMANRDPHIILITDGDVGNDSSLIRSCQTGIRISTVGIGYAAREGLLNRMAETSGGLCSLIPNEADLDSELAEMHRKWGQPVWQGLSLVGADENFRSPKFWDVWQDVPTTFFGRLDELPETTVVKGWFQGRGEYSEELKAIQTEDPVIYRAWARSRLLDLEDQFLVSKASPAELVSLSISAQVLCRFTAFTAIDTTEKVDMEKEMERVMQPVEQTMAKKMASPQTNISRVMSPVMRRAGGFVQPAPAPPAPCRAPEGGGAAHGHFEDDDNNVFGGGDEMSDAFCEAEPEMVEMFFESEDVWLGDEGPGTVQSGLFNDESGAPNSDKGLLSRMKDSLFGVSKNEAPKPHLPSKKSDTVFQSRVPELVPASPKDQSAKSKIRELLDLLNHETFLNLGDAPEAAALESCLKVVKNLILEVSKAIRNGEVPEAIWKEILGKLVDYQEALEDISASSGVKHARTLRKELATLMQTQA